MRPDRARWLEAGGSAQKLGLFEQIGAVAPFSDASGRVLAAVHPENPRVGTLSDWTGDRALLGHAEGWLAAQGCRVLRAPMELCTWFGYRVNLGPHLDAPFLMEVQERPERWLEAGFTPESHYASVLAEHAPLVARAAPIAAARRAEGWTLTRLGEAPAGPLSEVDFQRAVATLYRLSTEAFAEAWGYATIPEAALQAWYAPYRLAVDPRLVFVLRAPSGEDAGFLFGLPDLAAPERRWFIVKTMAVSPRFQGLGLGVWLIGEAHRVAAELGFAAGVHALMWTGSRSNRLGGAESRLLRRYAALEKRA